MKKMLLKVTIIALLLVIMYSTIVNALSFTVSMTPSSSNVNPSTEFTVVVKVANLDVGANGINTLSGTLNYDEDVFETINDSSIDGENGWSCSYNAENKKLTLSKVPFVKREENVFRVTFKTKEDVEPGTTGKIEFVGVIAGNSENEITGSDISTTITVGGSDLPVANLTNNSNTAGNLVIRPTNNSAIVTNPANKLANNTNVNTNSNTNTNQNTYVPGYVNQDNSTDENMPYTGMEDALVYFIGAAIILAVVFYIKFEKVNKDIM